MKNKTKFLGLALLSAAASLCSSCGSDDDDDTSTGGASGSAATPTPVGFPGEKACKPTASGTSTACRGVTPACLVYDGSKCTADRRCVMLLNDYAECADGHFRTCTLKSGAAGIVLCDVGPSSVAGGLPKCEWTGCVECGTETHPCCIGGCNAPLVCSSVPGTAAATCVMP